MISKEEKEEKKERREEKKRGRDCIALACFTFTFYLLD